MSLGTVSSLAVSAEATNLQLADTIQLPKHIEKESDVYQKSRAKDRNLPKWMNVIYSFSQDIVDGFDENSEEWLDYMREEKDEFEDVDLDEIISDTQKNVEATRMILTEIKEDWMNEQDPSVYFMARKHYLIAKIFLEVLEQHKDQIDVEEAIDSIDDDNLEFYRLGVFVSLEPYLVTSLVLASRHDDQEYINKYSELLDRFTFLFSRAFRERYKEITGVSEKNLETEEVQKLVEHPGFYS